MALAYFCNTSILQREGPKEALGQRSQGVNNLLFLPLSLSFFLDHSLVSNGLTRRLASLTYFTAFPDAFLAFLVVAKPSGL